MSTRDTFSKYLAISAIAMLPACGGNNMPGGDTGNPGGDNPGNNSQGITCPDGKMCLAFSIDRPDAVMTNAAITVAAAEKAACTPGAKRQGRVNTPDNLYDVGSSVPLDLSVGMPTKLVYAMAPLGCDFRVAIVIKATANNGGQHWDTTMMWDQTVDSTATGKTFTYEVKFPSLTEASNMAAPAVKVTLSDVFSHTSNSATFQARALAGLNTCNDPANTLDSDTMGNPTFPYVRTSNFSSIQCSSMKFKWSLDTTPADDDFGNVGGGSGSFDGLDPTKPQFIAAFVGVNAYFKLFDKLGAMDLIAPVVNPNSNARP